MDMYMMTDDAIAEEMGDRLKALRLNKNYRQKDIAELTGLSIKAVLNAEKGKSTLVTYIKILRVLKSIDSLNRFIPKEGVSPLQLAKLRGKKRKRASIRKKP